jgi:hypothetical protein
VRRFVTPDNVSELLDLNSVVLVSAESASSVEKLLAASQWGDEPVPATVVLLDSDQAGDEIKAKIVGKGRTNQDRIKKLIDEEFVLQIASLVSETAEQKTVTTEDIVPPKLFGKSVERYVKHWHPEKYQANHGAIGQAVADPTFSANGLVAGTTDVFNRLVHDQPKPFDKMGVLQEVVALLAEQDHGLDREIAVLKDRLVRMCHEVRRAVSACLQAARRRSGKQSIQRLIKEFFKTNKESSTVFDIQLLLERIQRDTKLLGEDGDKLDASLRRLMGLLDKARAADQQRFRDDEWRRWSTVINDIYKSPLDIQVRITDDGPETDSGDSEPATAPQPAPAAA